MINWLKKATTISIALLSLLALKSVNAAPPLTQVQDMLYKADGSEFTGLVVIEWKSFEAADTSNIATNVVQLKIVNGLLRAKLVPTTNATPGAYYSVRYVSDGKVQYGENWSVPPSQNALRVRDVRITAAPTTAGGGSLNQLGISDITGLQEELNVRPVMGPNYVQGRTAFINESGQMDAVSGGSDDCVHVDGTSGVCGGSFANVQFVDGETPAGTIDGVNTSFTLTQPPAPATSLLLYRNGMLQKQLFDYTLSGNAVHFVSNDVPQSGDVLLASYRNASQSGGTPAVVLCTGPGISTSATSGTSLATCQIPAGTLRAGDRVQILFDYSHEGTLVAPQHEVRWGASSLQVRTGTASTTLWTGSVSMGVYASGGQYSAESWGTNLARVDGIGTLTTDPMQAVTIDFRGNMASSTSETVTLRNYTVIRNPIQQ